MILYVFKRLAYLPLQLLGISFVAFFMVRLIPGDPAYVISGPLASPQAIARLEESLGLDEPIWTQYVSYLQRVMSGDWGTSLFTSEPVISDLRSRVPATLELTTLALIFTIALGIPLGIYAARRRNIVAGSIRTYDMLSGAVPDFWLGLVLAYVFFTLLGFLPAPLGRLSPGLIPPEGPTGFLTVDALLAGDFVIFRDALAHLVLPVATLVLVNAAPVVKMTRSALLEVESAPYMNYARACGLPNRLWGRYAMRAALPPVVTLLGVIYAYLLGGAVLVEKVFSWGGVGQYAVDAVTHSDFAPIQGFVLIAAAFSLVVYLVVDLIHHWLDPRLTLRGTPE